MPTSGRNGNGYHRMRGYIRGDKGTVFWDKGTVFWVSIGLIALVTLGVLYFYWDTEEKIATDTGTPAQTIQSTAPTNAGPQSGSSSATPGNANTTGSTPSR